MLINGLDGYPRHSKFIFHLALILGEIKLQILGVGGGGGGVGVGGGGS